MAGYTEACSPSEDGNFFTLARDGKGQVGVLKKLLWTKSSLVATRDEAKSQAYWNTQIAAGNAVYVGEIEEFVANNTAATFYESPNGNIRKLDVAEKRIEQYRLIECACTAAQIQKMNGQNGRLFFETEDGYIVGKSTLDGQVQGQQTSQFEVGLATRPVTGTPVSYLPIDVTYASPKDDDANPFDAQIDWAFESLDEVNAMEFTITTAAAATATNFTFSLNIGRGCKELALAGVALADLKFVDPSGNVLTGTVTANGDNYDIDLTTTSALASVKVSSDGIRTINSTLYAGNEFTVAV